MPLVAGWTIRSATSACSLQMRQHVLCQSQHRPISLRKQVWLSRARSGSSHHCIYCFDCLPSSKWCMPISRIIRADASHPGLSQHCLAQLPLNDPSPFLPTCLHHEQLMRAVLARAVPPAHLTSSSLAWSWALGSQLLPCCGHRPPAGAAGRGGQPGQGYSPGQVHCAALQGTRGPLLRPADCHWPCHLHLHRPALESG